MVTENSYINLDALHEICKGDKDKELKYLTRFLEMIPLSIQNLKLGIEEEDRSQVMKEIHFMLPHLIFFGIYNLSGLMEREKEYNNLLFDALKSVVIEALNKIERALGETETIIDNL